MVTHKDIVTANGAEIDGGFHRIEQLDIVNRQAVLQTFTHLYHIWE